MLRAKFRKYQNYKKSATLKMTIIIKTLSLNSIRIEMIFVRFSFLRKRKKHRLKYYKFSQIFKISNFIL
jgi:hypothetical protein